MKEGTKLLGRLAWRAGKSVLRRQLPALRVYAAAALSVVVNVAAAAMALRRIAG